MARLIHLPVAQALIMAVACLLVSPLASAHDWGIGAGVNSAAVCTLSNTNPTHLSDLMAGAAGQAVSHGAVSSFATGLVNGLLSAHHQGCQDAFFSAIGGAVSVGGVSTTTAVATAFVTASASGVSTDQGRVLTSATATAICRGGCTASGIATAWTQAVAIQPSSCAVLNTAFAHASASCGSAYNAVFTLPQIICGATKPATTHTPIIITTGMPATTTTTVTPNPRVVVSKTSPPTRTTVNQFSIFGSRPATNSNDANQISVFGIPINLSNLLGIFGNRPTTTVTPSITTATKPNTNNAFGRATATATADAQATGPSTATANANANAQATGPSTAAANANANAQAIGISTAAANANAQATGPSTATANAQATGPSAATANANAQATGLSAATANAQASGTSTAAADAQVSGATATASSKASSSGSDAFGSASANAGRKLMASRIIGQAA
jgi:hypothetical protein